MADVGNFLAVDLGASGGRVLHGRFDGTRFELSELHRFDNLPVTVLGHLHWDALRLWAEIKDGLRRYHLERREPLNGISVDTWGVDFALLDRAGRLLGNPHHYRDARTDGVPQKVFERVSAEALYSRTGLQVMPINTLYQLYSMVATNDPQLECAETFLMMPDLFHYWLTGEKACEYTIASTSQLLHASERRWAVELLEQLDIPTAILPPLRLPGELLGTVRADVAAEVGLDGVPVMTVGCHDTASAVAAVPDLDERSAYVSSGTWSLVGVEVPEPVLNERARELNFTNEGGVGGVIRLLKNVAGLWLLQESRRQWQREGADYGWIELLELAAQAEAFRSIVDPDAPEFLAPGDIPRRIRAYCRRTGQPEPEGVGAVARCCLESLALRYRWIVDALEGLSGRRIEAVRIVGGGSRNALLNQFTADACGRTVVAGPVEATALGNLLMQAVASGHLSGLESGRRAVAASVERRWYRPQPTDAWHEAYARFVKLL
jgi:rhamnulokinase